VLRGVVAGVEQDVAEGVAFARGAEATGVISLGEEGSAAAQVGIDSSSEAHAQSVHAAAQGGGAVGLDEHVDVVAKGRG
jgi:hypothetical protein